MKKLTIYGPNGNVLAMWFIGDTSDLDWLLDPERPCHWVVGRVTLEDVTERLAGERGVEA